MKSTSDSYTMFAFPNKSAEICKLNESSRQGRLTYG